MNSSPTITRAALATLAFLGLVACDLQKIGNQAAAKTVAVSTLLATPAIEVKGSAVAGNGFDAGLSGLDAGGLVFDGGLTLDDAGIHLPAQNLAFVFFGQRAGESPDSAPVGTPGATATLTQVGGPTFSLEDQGGGSYALFGDAGFVYQPGATYQFEFKLAAQTFLAEVEDVPSPENIPQFHPSEGYLELDAGSGFSFLRPDPPQGQNRNLGFVNVFAINTQGTAGQPTFTNIPSTAVGFIKLLIAPTDWTVTRVDIPGSAFPDPDSNYIVVLQSAKLGGPKSDNLFSGSPILAGTANVAIIKTRK